MTTSSRWYYTDTNNQSIGPIAAHGLQALYTSGVISSKTLIFPEGGTDWRPYHTVFLVERPSVPAPVSTRSSQDELPQINVESLGGYVRSTLQPNERPMFKTTFSWVLFVRPVIYILIAMELVYLGVSNDEEIGLLIPNQVLFYLGILLLLLKVPSLISRIIAFITSEFVITDRRILIKAGWIRRSTLEMFVAKVESVSVYQGIAGRLLNYGSLTIRGTGTTTETYLMIARPVEFRNWVQRVSDR